MIEGQPIKLKYRLAIGALVALAGNPRMVSRHRPGTIAGAAHDVRAAAVEGV
jgi:hypothetical protein